MSRLKKAVATAGIAVGVVGTMIAGAPMASADSHIPVIHQELTIDLNGIPEDGLLNLCITIRPLDPNAFCIHI